MRRVLMGGMLCVVAMGTGACAVNRADVDVDVNVSVNDGWVDLFNGEDLTGWTGGMEGAWIVEGGEIVTAKPGQGWWLRTDRMFRDFELELDFWMPEGGNSGLGLRGSSGGDPAFTGFEVQMLDTHGEAPGLRNCGAVYEAIAPSEMAINKPDSWNTYRVKLVGDTLDVWLNGVHIHDSQQLDGRGYYREPVNTLPLNTRATTGYIALQDHGHAFRFRNIRIKDLSPDPEPRGMVNLIRGEDDQAPEGWFSEDAAVWTVVDGSLIGRDGPGHLFTETEYTDFEMRTLVKVNTRGNSGIYYHAQPNPDPNNPWPAGYGYEVQVDQHDPKNYTGCIYNTAWPESGPGKDGPITRDNAWFDYRVRCEGDRVRTWINGVLFVDAELGEFSSGRFALQGHHNGNVIEFKDFRVLSLD